MSVASMIESYAIRCTIIRPTMGRDATGGSVITSTASATTANIYVQVLNGSTNRKYGGERAMFSARAYAKPDIDIRTGDLVQYIDSVGTRHYRVEGVVTPDDRASSDSLAFQQIDLQEDRPRT